MALTYRTKGQASRTSSDPATLSLTTASGDALLVCYVSSQTTGARTGGSPTWNSVALTQVGTTQAGSAECSSELWWMANPAVGSYSLSLPNSGLKEVRLMAALFTGSTPTVFGTTQTGTSAASPSLWINSVPAGGLAAAVLGHGYGTAPTGRGGTAVYENDEGEYCTCSSYKQVATLGNQNLYWDFGGSDDVAMVMAAWQEVTTVTIPVAMHYNQTRRNG